MDLNDIRKLVRLMIGAELTELEIDDTKRGLRVYLKRRSGEVAGQGGVVQPVVHVVPGHGGPSLGGAPAPESAQPAAAAAGPPPGTTVFASPMVGTFYRSPSPEADSFVEVGSQFNEESVLCIIEAMKVMNEIKAETKGQIVEILVENGEPVEFGQPLFILKRS